MKCFTRVRKIIKTLEKRGKLGSIYGDKGHLDYLGQWFSTWTTVPYREHLTMSEDIFFLLPQLGEGGFTGTYWVEA